MKKVMSGVALLLVFALLAGMVPAEPWLDMISAKAESKAEDHPAEPATDTLEKGGWVYRVFTDGFVELLGYTDTSVRTLALPRAIDGAWVVRVGENAFANNTALSEVSIPTAISEIPDSAFPNARGLTVECYMGSAARKLANRRGFTVKNLSEYDFQPDVVDLSDIRSAQWSFSAGSLHAAAPYNRFLKPGAKLYLPPRGQYTTGIPLQVVSASGSEAVVEELAIWSTLVSYKVEDEMLYPDYSTTQVLCEGVTLVDDGRRAKGPSVKLGREQAFEVEIKLSDHFKVTGSISYSCSGKASVDINLFEGLKSVSFSKTQTFDGSVGVVASVKGGSEGDEDEDGNTWTANIESLGDIIREDPKTKKL